MLLFSHMCLRARLPGHEVEELEVIYWYTSAQQRFTAVLIYQFVCIRTMLTEVTWTLPSTTSPAKHCSWRVEMLISTPIAANGGCSAVVYQHLVLDCAVYRYNSAST